MYDELVEMYGDMPHALKDLGQIIDHHLPAGHLPEDLCTVLYGVSFHLRQRQGYGRFDNVARRLRNMEFSTSREEARRKIFSFGCNSGTVARKVATEPRAGPSPMPGTRSARGASWRLACRSLSARASEAKSSCHCASIPVPA